MVKIFALADLHLSLGVPSKTMELFGSNWTHYMERMEKEWKGVVGSEDLVLIAGDISWAMKLEQAKKDLEWIDALPGTKVMIRGNHDYWWSSLAKVSACLPSSIHAIQGDVYNFHGISIGGTRLWDSDEYDFNRFIEFRENPKKKHVSAEGSEPLDDQRIFLREIERLKMSLQKLDPKADLRIVMTHYPPIGADLQPSIVSKLLSEYHVDICTFGHLHQVKKGSLPFGRVGGVEYFLTASDYLEFKPLLVCQL